MVKSVKVLFVLFILVLLISINLYLGQSEFNNEDEERYTIITKKDSLVILGVIGVCLILFGIYFLVSRAH